MQFDCNGQLLKVVAAQMDTPAVRGICIELKPDQTICEMTAAHAQQLIRACGYAEQQLPASQTESVVAICSWPYQVAFFDSKKLNYLNATCVWFEQAGRCNMVSGILASGESVVVCLAGHGCLLWLSKHGITEDQAIPGAGRLVDMCTMPDDGSVLLLDAHGCVYATDKYEAHALLGEQDGICRPRALQTVIN